MSAIEITKQEWEVTVTREEGDEWGPVGEETDPVRVTVLFISDGKSNAAPVRVTVAGRLWFDDYNAGELLAKADPWLVSIVTAARDRIAGKG
jgi:hypothetical protein